MLAAEVTAAGLKIRINSVAPGVFPSEMITGDSDEAQKRHIPSSRYEGKIPGNRPGKDEDMAGALLMAVTNQYVNGQRLVVDGGYTLAAGL